MQQKFLTGVLLPHFDEHFTCNDFCRRAAEELMQVASGIATGLGEENPT
ncbi:hypothetical protein [Prevotella sp.]